MLGSDITAPPAEDGIDFLAADLGKRDGWKGLLDGALKKLGTISLFIHSASPRRLEADTPLSVSEATWDAMTDINLRAGFFLSREVGRHMRDNKIIGRILLITSQHREMPRNLPHYSASKAGMTMVMKELARSLAPDGIRVNAIAPGAIPGGGSSPTISAPWWRRSRSAAPARPTTLPRSLSRSCQKDLVVMSWARR